MALFWATIGILIPSSSSMFLHVYQRLTYTCVLWLTPMLWLQATTSKHARIMLIRYASFAYRYDTGETNANILNEHWILHHEFTTVLARVFEHVNNVRITHANSAEHFKEIKFRANGRRNMLRRCNGRHSVGSALLKYWVGVKIWNVGMQNDQYFGVSKLRILK